MTKSLTALEKFSYYKVKSLKFDDWVSEEMQNLLDILKKSMSFASQLQGILNVIGWGINHSPTEPHLFSDITLGSISGSRGPMCSMESLHQCLSTLQSVAQNQDFSDVTTKPQLYTACRKFHETFKCADRHMKRCFGAMERKVYYHVLGGARDLIGELCVEGSVQDDFLKYAECYSNLSRETDSCSSVSKKLAFLSESVDMVEDAEKGLKRSCCTYKSFVQCKNEQVIRKCGPEAGSFHERHLNKISDPLLHEHCASFVYILGDCSSLDSPFQSGHSNDVKLSSCLAILSVIAVCYVDFIKNCEFY